MVNILLCGNKKVFDGALTQLISMTNRTKADINCYIFTMDVSRINPDFVPIDDEQIEFLNKVVRTKNPGNKVTKVDITDFRPAIVLVLRRRFKESSIERSTRQRKSGFNIE